MVLCQNFCFGVDWKFNMAARANNVFWLVKTLKIFLLETEIPIGSNVKLSRVMAAILNFQSANDSQV
jgi:hypothetical protein